MARAGGRARGVFADFKAFLMQGNVVDLAVAVIIGGAFGKIVQSFIEDVITPAILNPVMKSLGVDQLEALVYNGIKYGSFLAAVLNFIVIAFVIFLMIRALENAKRKMSRAEALAEAEAEDPALAVQSKLADSVDRLTLALNQQRLP